MSTSAPESMTVERSPISPFFYPRSTLRESEKEKRAKRVELSAEVALRASEAALRTCAINAKKTENREICRVSFMERKNSFLLLGNDVFSGLFLVAQSLGLLLVNLGKSSAFTSLTSVCGVLAGVLMFFLGAADLKAGVLKLKNGEPRLYGWLLAITGGFEMAIALVLLVSAIAVLCCTFGCTVGFIVAINAFFIANPWLLPVILLIPSIISLIEIGKKLHKAWKGQDIYGQINLANLKTAIESFRVSSAEGGGLPPDASEEQQKALVRAFATFLSKTYEFTFDFRAEDTAQQMAEDILIAYNAMIREKTIEEMLQREIKKQEQAILIRLRIDKVGATPEEKKLTEEEEKLIKNHGLTDATATLTPEGEVQLTFLPVREGEEVISYNLKTKQFLLFSRRVVIDDPDNQYNIYLKMHCELKYEKDKAHEKQDKFLSAQVENLTSNMGLDGALHTGEFIAPMILVLNMIQKGTKPARIAEFMQLKTPLLGGRNFLEQVQEIRKDQIKWNNILIIRLVIQILYIFSFLASVAAIFCTLFDVNTVAHMITAGQDIMLALANLVSIYVDCQDFLRGLPKVADNVAVKKQKKKRVGITLPSDIDAIGQKRFQELEAAWRTARLKARQLARLKALLQSLEQEKSAQAIKTLVLCVYDIDLTDEFVHSAEETLQHLDYYLEVVRDQQGVQMDLEQYKLAQAVAFKRKLGIKKSGFSRNLLRQIKKLQLQATHESGLQAADLDLLKRLVTQIIAEAEKGPKQAQTTAITAATAATTAAAERSLRAAV